MTIQTVKQTAVAKQAVIRQWMRRNEQLMRIASRSLVTLHQSRGGGFLSKSLAVLSIVTSILDETAKNPIANLFNRGYQATNIGIGSFLHQLLMPLLADAKIEDYDNYQILFIGEDNSVAFVEEHGGYNNGPYTLGGDIKELTNLVSTCAWTQGKDLALEVGKTDDDPYTLSPISDPGPYIGNPPPEFYADRLRRYGSAPRTLILEGPTRVGKSVLARHVAKNLGSGNTLRVSGELVDELPPEDLQGITTLCQPSVLLIDDLDMSVSFRLLNILEMLRIPGSTTIITIMRPVCSANTRRRGDRYTEGMAPGRIDEIFTLYPPDDVHRDKILRHYYEMFMIPVPKDQKQIVAKTKGLTGGYLGEFVRRLSAHGEESWKTELELLLYLAPPIDDEDEEVEN